VEGDVVRFLKFTLPNTDPEVPSRWMAYPMLVDEEEVCTRQEEFDRIERLPLHWDEQGPEAFDHGPFVDEDVCDCCGRPW
jgi:hypothetical protein